MNKNKSLSKFTKSYEFLLLCVVVLLVAALAVATHGRSIAADNLVDMIVGYSAYGIIAAGVLFVIISGGIDISFMAVGAVAQYLAALYMLNNGGNWLIVILISLVTGAILGFGNAILVNKLKVPTLIITIGTMNIIYGVMMKVTRGIRLHGFPTWFSNKSDTMLFIASIGILIVVMVVSWFILRKTKMGRSIYAIGGNVEAAKRCGINVLKTHLFVYGYAGAMAGLGALVKCYLTQQASIEALYGNELDVIAMVVLGGVALQGGKGSIMGTVLGIILIAVLSNGMTLMGVSSYWTDLVIGMVILISFCITGWRMLAARKKGGQIL